MAAIVMITSYVVSFAFRAASFLTSPLLPWKESVLSTRSNSPVNTVYTLAPDLPSSVITKPLRLLCHRLHPVSLSLLPAHLTLPLVPLASQRHIHLLIGIRLQLPTPFSYVSSTSSPFKPAFPEQASISARERVLGISTVSQGSTIPRTEKRKRRKNPRVVSGGAAALMNNLQEVRVF